MNVPPEPPAEEETHAPSHLKPNPSPRILLVDDDLANCRLNSRLLVRSGYEVDTAQDGQAGWEALHAHCYDLLITDNTMPRLSGLELVKKLRSAQMMLPVVLASGTLGRAELNRNQWLNIAATLWKPFTAGQLLETVKEALRVAGSLQTRGGISVSELAQPFSHIEPTSHWGLNE
jgi:CheY-like chemotaxis protein